VVADAYLRQCGILRCDSLQELLDSALLLSSQPLPAGNRIAVLTNAGGPGILASDALEKYDLRLAELSEKTKRQLRAVLPEEASVNNPVDMIASANHETYAACARILLDDENTDGLLIIVVKPPVDTTPGRIAARLKPVIDNSDKPIIITLMARRDKQAGMDTFREMNVPVFSFPEDAARATGNMLRYKKLRATTSEFKRGHTAHIQAVPQSRQAAVEETAGILRRYKMPLMPFLVTGDIEAASRFLNETGPVALKVANENIIHKSDAGLVHLNISDDQHLRKVFEKLRRQIKDHIAPEDRPQILVQKMAASGRELVIGAKRDVQFGPVVMFGLGGIMVELMKDVSFRVAPFTLTDAREMINEIRGADLLKGFRKYKPLDLDVLAEMLVRTGSLMLDNPQISELDMNPLIWADDSKHPFVVDFRMTVYANTDMNGEN